MKRYAYAEAARMFPRVRSHAMMSLLKRLPLFHYSFLIGNLAHRSNEVTHMVIEDYIKHYMDEHSAQSGMESLQYLVAKDVDHQFVDRVATRYIAILLLSKQSLGLSK